MDLKGIDLQMALPRLQDVGTQQHQQAQKLAADQQQLTDQQVKQLETERRRLVRSEQPAGAKIAERDGSGGSGARDPRPRKRTPEAGEEREHGEFPVAHPFKGKYIDRRL